MAKVKDVGIYLLVDAEGDPIEGPWFWTANAAKAAATADEIAEHRGPCRPVLYIPARGHDVEGT